MVPNYALKRNFENMKNYQYCSARGITRIGPTESHSVGNHMQQPQTPTHVYMLTYLGYHCFGETFRN